MKRALLAAMVTTLLLSSGCVAARHGRPVIDTGDKPAGVGGTISGTVRSDGGTSLTGRKVSAINAESGARFEATTSSTGGYTIQVPTGNYRIEVELRDGEALTSEPRTTRINLGDIDEAQNLVVRGAR